jgi:peptidoglycan/xylan/chitin deacetylase (PgdA/CDA1 family)
MSADGYPWYWRMRTMIPKSVRQNLRVGVDATTAFAVGSVNRVRDPGLACLTLDDGPDPVVTPLMLQALSDAQVRCTFFLLSERAREYPDVTRDIIAGGHEVALHGRDHRPVSGMGMGEVRSYLGTGKDELEQIIQQPVRYFRPPYGSQSPASYLGARRAGLDVVVWSTDAADWVDRPQSQVVADALAGIDAGGILLFHERLEPHPVRGAPTTTFDRVSAVAEIIEGLRVRGLRPGTVGEAASLRRTSWFRP